MLLLSKKTRRTKLHKIDHAKVNLATFESTCTALDMLASRSNFIDFRNHKNYENLAFSGTLPLLDCHKINKRTNFENPHGKNLDLKVKMCFTSKIQKNIPGQNKFYSGLAQNTPKIKTFFSYAVSLALALTLVLITE